MSITFQGLINDVLQVFINRHILLYLYSFYALSSPRGVWKWIRRRPKPSSTSLPPWANRNCSVSWSLWIFTAASFAITAPQPTHSLPSPPLRHLWSGLPKPKQSSSSSRPSSLRRLCSSSQTSRSSLFCRLMPRSARLLGLNYRRVTTPSPMAKWRDWTRS